jgi:hypothetical protein
MGGVVVVSHAVVTVGEESKIKAPTTTHIKHIGDE